MEKRTFKDISQSDFDLIGDIHGHADELKQLLLKLGYKKVNDTYTHPTRKVLFLGDYIDRGPKIPETLFIVKNMVDSGEAMALMGNHEYNAICYNTKDKKGEYCREHSEKNENQHKQTLVQFSNNVSDYKLYIEWFMTLPLFFETENFRTVHACWDNENISFLKTKLKDAKLKKELLIESTKEGTALHKAIEETLKGKELKLLNGLSFKDKDGHGRTDIRIKWWENPAEQTYHSICVHPLENIPKLAIEEKLDLKFYNRGEKPVFFGHYWLKGNPFFYKNNICCLDYSVAKEGSLAAYRFDNKKLKLENFVIV